MYADFEFEQYSSQLEVFFYLQETSVCQANSRSQKKSWLTIQMSWALTTADSQRSLSSIAENEKQNLR